MLSIEDGVSARLKVTRARRGSRPRPARRCPTAWPARRTTRPRARRTRGRSATGRRAGRHRDPRLRGSRPVPRDADRPRRRHGARHRDRDRHGRRPATGTVAVQTARPWRASARRCAPAPPGRTSRSRSGAAACRWPSGRPADGRGRSSFSYSSPVAATDTVTACVDKPARAGNVRRTADVEWWFRPGGAGRALGRRDARRVERGRGRDDLAQLPDALATSAGTTSANPGVLWYSARKFKDFELSVDYRVAAVGNNGGVLLRFPAPANVADADAGYQVAILDNGAAGMRTGAITQERGTVTSFAPSSATNFKPTREWNTLKIGRRARTSRCASTACWRGVPRREPQRPRGLHRPRERRQQPHVPQRAHQGARARHDGANSHRRRPRGPRCSARRSPLNFSCADEPVRGRCVARSTAAGRRRRALNATPGPLAFSVTGEGRRGQHDDAHPRLRGGGPRRRHGRRHGAGDARADARPPARLRRFTPGVAKTTRRRPPRRSLDGRRRDPDRPTRAPGARAAGQRQLLARRSRCRRRRCAKT